MTELPPLPEPSIWGYDVPEPPLKRELGLYDASEMLAYGAACAAAATEAAAQACNKIGDRYAAWGYYTAQTTAYECAAAIRARKP